MAIDAPTGAAPFRFNPLEFPHLENPYPLYAQARRAAPVFFSPLSVTWAVTRYEDVHAILRDSRRFSSSYLLRAPVDPPPEVLAMRGQLPPEMPLLVSEDPPDHTRTRALGSHAFLPKIVGSGQRSWAAPAPYVRRADVEGVTRDGRATGIA